MRKGSKMSEESKQKSKDTKAAVRDLIGKRDAVSWQILKEIEKLSLEDTILEIPEVFYKSVYAAIRVLTEKSLCSSEYTIRTRSAIYLIDKLDDEKFIRTIDQMRGKGAKVAAGTVQWGEKEEKGAASKKRGRKVKK